MMRRLLPVVAVVLGVAAVLSACGSSAAPVSGDTTGASTPVVVHVTISGSTVTPNGETIDVPLGSTVELDIQADADGEIHVHSSPEQEIEYHAGTTQASLGAFTIPGGITVESHTLDKVIATLKVQ